MSTERLEDWENPPEDADKAWLQRRGRAFERVINGLLEGEGLEPRSSFHPAGEEVDGSFQLNHKTFLLEAKWRKNPIPASDLYAFRGKVDGKLVGTIGVFISMSDYSKEAIDALMYGKCLNLILFSADDFRAVWSGAMTFSQAMRLKLRYAAEEGQPFVPLTADGPGEQKQHVNSTPPVSVMELRPAKGWDVVVEGYAGEDALRIIFNRLNVQDPVRFWVAGGQLGIPNLVRRLRESGHTNIAAVVDSDATSQSLDHLRLAFKEQPENFVVVYPCLEDWLEDACPADIVNFSPPTSVPRKAARRYANGAVLKELLRKSPEFAAMAKKILGNSVATDDW